MYLEEPAVIETLRFVADCAPGSAVLFEYVRPPQTLAPVLRIAVEQLMARLAAQALAARLPGLGLRHGHSWTPDELNARYLADRQDGLRLGTGPGRLMRAEV